MDNHHAINGKIHYFDGHGFTSLLYVYQRVWSATTSTLTPWWWRVGLLKPFAWQRVSHKDLKMFHKNGHPLTPCQRFRRPACARRFNRCGGNKFFGVTNSGSECEYNCGFLGWGISSQTGECDIAGYETKVHLKLPIGTDSCGPFSFYSVGEFGPWPTYQKNMEMGTMEVSHLAHQVGGDIRESSSKNAEDRPRACREL